MIFALRSIEDTGGILMKTISIVDDEPSILKLVSSYLSSEGYKVTTYLNGKNALNSYAYSVPDLVVLDLNLPVLTGEEVLHLMRKAESFKNIPVLVITGYKDVEKIRRISEMGVKDYIIKPINREDFINRIKRALGELTEIDESLDLTIPRRRALMPKVDGKLEVGRATVYKLYNVKDIRLGMVLGITPDLKERSSKYKKEQVVTKQVIKELDKYGIRDVYIRSHEINRYI